MAPAKKGRGRPKAAPTKITKVPKAKVSARRTSDRMTPNKRAPTAAAKGKRQVLGDKTNQQNDSDTEEVDDFEPVEDVYMEGDEQGYKASVAAVGKTRKTKKAPVKQTASAPKEILNTVAAKELRQKSRTTKKALVRVEVPEEASPEKYVPETQVAAMEVDQPNEREEVEEVVAEKSSKSAQSRSVHRQPQPVQRPRAGSTSDTERGDPNLRRKLGELSKKYDVLNTRYQDLREIGLKEAERNFERLRKQMEEKTKSMCLVSGLKTYTDHVVANELIAALKADLVAQTALAMDSQAVKKRVDTFQAQISQLTTLLSESQIENKALSAKLAANRTTVASVESVNARIPGSAVKAGGVVRMMGTAEAAQVAQAAQLKEDLYSDLTGLIMRSVKRDAEEDVFDCIQTGRNGSK